MHSGGYNPILIRLLLLAEGNCGSLTVVGKLWKRYGDHIIDLLELDGIQGDDIWILFKYGCGEDYARLFKSLVVGDAKSWLTDYQNPIIST